MADRLNAAQQRFIAQQKMFFVATAPRADDGRVNLSPKGLDGTFAVIDDQTVAYLDLTGSGGETIAHLRENGRICLMFCAFSGRANILRIHGRGVVIATDDASFAELSARFPPLPAVRSIIVVHATRVKDSCGFGAPRMDYVGERDELPAWAEKKGPEGVAAYRRKNNARSLDGLPGV